ncbi:MAG: hypothetical protein J0L67_18300 [Cytophagales bacterium]|nr:hypothetical protein [Cytophagales bacterium]
MFSCSNEQELKPEVKILREDWHRLVNINYVAQNEPVHTKVKNFITKNNLGRNYELTFSNETIHFLNDGFSQILTSTKNRNEYLVVTALSTGSLSYFFVAQQDQIFSFSTENSKLFEFNATDKRVTLSRVDAYPGNCNQLGPRRRGEAYGDCFVRNWQNFCCDFDGCAAQFATGQLVAIAIGLECLVEREIAPA